MGWSTGELLGPPLGAVMVPECGFARMGGILGLVMMGIFGIFCLFVLYDRIQAGR